MTTSRSQARCWRSRRGLTTATSSSPAATKASSICSPSRSAPSLSETVTDVLVERGDRDVVHSVVRNVGARFSDAGFRMLVRRSADDDALATEVGPASGHSAAAFPRAAGKGFDRGARAAGRRKSAGRGRHRRRGGRGGRRHLRIEARNASPDFAAAQGRRRAAKPHSADRRIRNLSIRARPQIRGDGDRAVDHVRHADRRRRTRPARSRRGNHPHPCQGRRAVDDDDQSGAACCAPPTAACRRKTSNMHYRASTACSRIPRGGC